MWLILALLSNAVYACSNILDTFLANKQFRNPFTLVFYTSFFNLAFIALLFAVQSPVIPPGETIPIFILLGTINIGYLYPYYRALQNDDTSVVVAFFALNRIFIPVLAFFMVGEVLEFAQYAGIFLLVSSVVVLGTHRDHKHFRLNKSAGYMLLASFIMAFEGVLLKYLFEHGVNFGTALGGEMIVSFILAMLFLVPKSTRSDVFANVKLFKKMLPVFAAEESFTFLGFAAESYAIVLAPVSLVKGITILSPFFLLIYARVLRNRFPNVFRESMSKGSVIKKTLLFALIIIGVLLMKG